MHLVEAVPLDHGRTLTPEISQGERTVRILKTILLAEDDDDLRYVMELSLSAMGYVVIACADAHLAWTAFRAHPAIDILLTDLEMPKRTGMELARELTALIPALPVMIITGSLLSSATMQEIHDRRWTYVSKPCRLSDLESDLKRLLAPELPAAAA